MSRYRDNVAQKIKHAFSVLYSAKTWVSDQSERAQGPIFIYIYVIKIYIYIYNIDIYE